MYFSKTAEKSVRFIFRGFSFFVGRCGVAGLFEIKYRSWNSPLNESSSLFREPNCNPRTTNGPTPNYPFAVSYLICGIPNLIKQTSPDFPSIIQYVGFFCLGNKTTVALFSPIPLHLNFVRTSLTISPTRVTGQKIFLASSQKKSIFLLYTVNGIVISLPNSLLDPIVGRKTDGWTFEIKNFDHIWIYCAEKTFFGETEGL